jgi:hypothetical protein
MSSVLSAALHAIIQQKLDNIKPTSHHHIKAMTAGVKARIRDSIRDSISKVIMVQYKEMTKEFLTEKEKFKHNRATRRAN